MSDEDTNLYTALACETPRRRIETIEELWALLKFQLLAKGHPDAIDAEIGRMVVIWRQHIDPSGHSDDDFRAKLYNLVREGIAEEIAAAGRRH